MERILRYLGSWVLVASAFVPTGPIRGGEGRLIAEFDCAQEYPPEQFFAHPDVSVVDSPLGKYRQAGNALTSRFGYRFSTAVGKPHLLVVHYPDDCRRNMAILDGTCYDIDAGIMTGFAHPLSGREPSSSIVGSSTGGTISGFPWTKTIRRCRTS